MTYRQKIITDNTSYLNIESDDAMNDIETIRHSLFTLLIATSLSAFPKNLRAYVEQTQMYNDFWTANELQDFMNTFYFTNERMASFIGVPANNVVLFGALETWLTSENTRTDSQNLGVCRQIEEIENKITRVVNSALVAKNTYDSVMDDISNLSTKNTIETAKKLVEGIADAQIQKVMTKIQNMTNLIGSIQDVTKSDVIQGKVLKIRDEMEDMVSETNIQRLKDMISGQLGLTASQFENIGAKEIRHIMDRACAISKNVALPFDRKSARLDSIAQYYASNSSALKNATNATTQNAINAGAYRYNTTVLRSRSSEIQRSEQAAIEAQPNSFYVPEATTEEISGVTPWNGGAGDERVTFNGPWVTKVGAEGWARVDSRVKVRLMRLQSLFGKQLIINSAYRPPAYNASVGGAKGSMHMKGFALDVKWAGFNASSKSQFIALARQCGFGGVGVNYRTFVHIDIGDKRSW